MENRVAWQDDDDNRKQRDPWTDKNGKNDNDGPPDLEQAIRRLFKNLKKPNPNDDDTGRIFNNNGGGGKKGR